jgi:hypothetical protein
VSYARIKNCRDITEEDISTAIESREDTKALLDHASTIAAPRTGGARVLLLFARMATSACDWLDGALRVEIAGEGDDTTIETFADIGAGLKERVFPPIPMRVPIEEFVIAVKKFPKAVAPLSMSRPSPRKLVLGAGEAEKVERPSTAPPPAKTAQQQRLKTLSLGDLPTVGGDRKSVPPPPAAGHVPAMVMSASQVPPARGSVPRIPLRERSVGEGRIATPPKFPPPARAKKTPSNKPPSATKPGAIALPLVQPEEPKPASPRLATRSYEAVRLESPKIESPKIESPKIESPKIEERAPEPSKGAPSQPLARIALKKQATAHALPRVVEEIDARSPAPPAKRASAAKKAFAVPPPPVTVPPEPPPSSEPDPEPAKKRNTGDVDEGWE